MTTPAESYLRPLEWCFHCLSTHTLIKIHVILSMRHIFPLDLLYMQDLFENFHFYIYKAAFQIHPCLLKIPLKCFVFPYEVCCSIVIHDYLQVHWVDATCLLSRHSPLSVKLFAPMLHAGGHPVVLGCK